MEAASAPTTIALSRREREVLEILARGVIDREAARIVGISLGTVRVYRKRTQDKLGTQGLVQTLLVAGKLGLIDLDAIADEIEAAASVRRGGSVEPRRGGGSAGGSQNAADETKRIV